MERLADRIAEELRVLVGQPLSDCWRAANMQIFGFGPTRQVKNRKGDLVDASDLSLHIQCRWRMVDGQAIVFGFDDLNYPADPSISVETFDWDKDLSVLDVSQRDWFSRHAGSPLTVTDVQGDAYGGFRIILEGGAALECFPCDSRRGDYSEHWRFFGHRADGSHFVITGDGVEAGSS
jgi:hypothetical protein